MTNEAIEFDHLAEEPDDGSTLPPEAAAAGITLGQWNSALELSENGTFDLMRALAVRAGNEKAAEYARLLREGIPQPQVTDNMDVNPSTKQIKHTYMRSVEKRTERMNLVREAAASDDPVAYWQRPDVRERVAEVGWDPDKLEEAAKGV